MYNLVHHDKDFHIEVSWTFNVKTLSLSPINIFIKIGLSSEKFITKMISEKRSTNHKSFNGFGRGHRIDWRNPMDIS